MCTALFAFGVHSRLLFFLAFNRDEYFQRPTKQAYWWEDGEEVFAGRDALRKGTWLAINQAGRFAFLTNIREVCYQGCQGSPSRGDLPVKFLQSSISPLEFLANVNIKEYNGLNLVAGDLSTGEVAYITNRGPDLQPILLPPGLYGLSNGVISANWPKVEKGKSMLEDLLTRPDISQASFPWDYVTDTLLQQCGKIGDVTLLPQTGLGDEVECELSSIFIEPTHCLGDGLYGTRSQTVLTAWDDNMVQICEATVQPKGHQPIKDKSFVKTKLEIPLAAAWRQCPGVP